MTDRTERMAFEKWAFPHKSQDYVLHLEKLSEEPDRYLCTQTTIAWDAWQAAVASRRD